jgi:hypothetical protein
VAHLARRHQFRHRTDALLDRNRGVTPMHVVEVDDIGPQSGQALIDALADVAGVVSGLQLADGAVGRRRGDAELRGEGYLVTTVGENFADQLLVLPAAVHVGGVDERDADVDAVVQGGQRFAVVDLAVYGRQRHCPETDCTDRQFVAESDSGHVRRFVSHACIPVIGDGSRSSNHRPGVPVPSKMLSSRPSST